MSSNKKRVRFPNDQKDVELDFDKVRALEQQDRQSGDEASEDDGLEKFGQRDFEGANGEREEELDSVASQDESGEPYENLLDQDGSEDYGQVRIVKFSMKEDMEEGKFDQDGTFIPTIDEDSLQDNWLEGISAAEMRAAKQAKQEQQKRLKSLESKQVKISEAELLFCLSQLLEPGESAIEALKKRGKSSIGSHHRRWGSKKKGADSNGTQRETAQAELDKREIEVITDTCSRLMEYGHYNIYEETLESLREKMEEARIRAH